jgi:hypothetical protein
VKLFLAKTIKYGFICTVTITFGFILVFYSYELSREFINSPKDFILGAFALVIFLALVVGVSLVYAWADNTVRNQKS